MYDLETQTLVKHVDSSSIYEDILAVNSQFLFSRSSDFNIKMRDKNTMQPICDFVGHASSLRSLTCNELYAFSGSYDSTLK